MTDLSDHLLAAVRAAPQLDPSMLYGVAQTSTLDNVPDNAQATQAFGAMVQRKTYLEAQDPKVQAAAWASAGDPERKMLAAAGYNAPNLQSHHQSLFGWAVHNTVGRGAQGLALAGKVVGVPVGDALHYAGSALRAVQHTYRAAALMTDENVLEGRGQWSLHGTYSPSEWARMWRESEHGEQTFSPVAVRKFSDQYDPTTLEMARSIASGVSPDKIVLAAPEADRAALAQRLNSDTDLRDAVRHFQSAKISVGRRVVGDGYIYSHPLAGRVLSGGVDAVADWYGDPLVVGTKVTKGAELARYLVRDASDVERLGSNPNVQRALADASGRLNSGGAAALIERYPKLAPVATQLVQEGVDSPQKLHEWFKGQAGMAALLDGRATGATKAMPQMLKLNPLEQGGLALKGGLKKVIDFAADTPYRIAQRTGDEEAAGAIQQFVANRVGGAGRLARQMTTLMARAPGMVFDPTSDQAPTIIQRLAAYALPAGRQREVVNAFTEAPNLATKRNIYKGLLNELGGMAGIDATEEGRAWLSNFTSRIDESISKPLYSSSGADVVTRDGIEARRALLEGQMTTEWALPDFAAFWAQSKRANVLGRVYGGTINSDGIDHFMSSVWKPSMLLRLGFPIRAGGEELVSAIMREGPLGIIRGRLASGALDSQIAAEDRLLPFHPLHSIYERMTSHLPEQIKGVIDTPGEFVGAVIGDRARRAFRNVEVKLAGQEYMDAARKLFESGALDSAAGRHISAVESRAAGYLDDDPSVIKIAKDGSHVRPAELRGTGKFRDFVPQETHQTLAWQKNLGEVGQSNLGRAVLANIDASHEEQVRAVQDVIESPWFDKMRARSDRSLFTSDGRVVGSGVATAIVDDAGRPVPVYHGTTQSFESFDLGAASKNALQDTPESGFYFSKNQRVAEQYIALRGGAPDALGNVAGAPNVKRVYLDIRNPYSASTAGPYDAEMISRLKAEGFDGIVYHRPSTLSAEHDASEVVAFTADQIHASPATMGRAGEATAEQANRDWAEAVVEHVNSVVRSPDGSAVADIVPNLLTTRQPPRITDLNAVPFELRPDKVKGEEVLPVSRNAVRDLMDKGFYHVVGRPMDWMVRQPLMVHNYAESLKEVAGLRASLEGVADADKIVHEVAFERAVNKTTPYIHDPQLRSQFSVETRNLAPFWFAQEQFYKRWINVFQHSPEAFRQAQLVMMGMRHTGILRTDDQGNDFFLYPGAAAVQQVLSRGFETVTGHKVSLPLPVGFSGQVRFATPGLERLGVPSFGPLVGIPMRALASRFPELAQVEQDVLGERGAGRAYWEQITPTTISRAIHVAIDRPESSSQYASAMMQAMAYLEANGFSPADNASPVEREAYIERVKNWTRILFVNRLLFGYAAPAAPQVELDPDQLHTEYRNLLSTLPIQDAQKEFIRRHPDATSFTVFGSKSASGAPLPATEQTVQFMNQHSAFLSTYPQAGGWFLPAASADSKFSIAAYREQLALELRTRKAPAQFYADIKYAEGSDAYFRNRDAKDKALKAATDSGNSSRATTIRTAWDEWKTAYFTAHPVFAERLQAPDAQIRRGQTIDQLHQALQDPRLPKTAETEAARTLVTAWDDLQGALAPIAGARTALATKRRAFMKTAFGHWADGYVVDHPEAKGLYQSVFKPQIDTGN